MNCVNPFYLEKEKIWVPCGRCILCRIQRAKEWSVRLTHEVGYWEQTSFVTLTYAPEHLPHDGSIHKTELQKFFKRLRRYLDSEGRKIMYYACGEYGDQNGRPHYHVIFYGVGSSSHDKGLIEKAWPFGLTYIGTASYDSCRYVADYVQKKLYGLRAHEYDDAGLEQPFSLMSQKIGLRWAHDNQAQLMANFGITVNGVAMSIPRYYVKKLDIPTELLLKKGLKGDSLKKAKFQKILPDCTGLDWLGQKNKIAKRLEFEANTRQKAYKKGKI